MARPWALLALAWIAGFTLIDSSIVSLALPDIAREFNRPVADLAWVATGFLLALAATLLAAGRLSDRFGPRIVLAGGAALFTIATLGAGLAPTFDSLVAIRVVQGIAGGVLYTVSLAIVASFPAERRAGAISIYFTSGATSAVIGPVLGGWLTDLGGWRFVFLAQLPVPVLVIFLSLVLLPATRGEKRSLDVAGIAAAGLFTVSATLALLEISAPNGLPIALVAAAVAVGSLAAFVVIERRSAYPAVRLDIFRNRRFVISSIIGAGAWFNIMSTVIFIALYLQLARGFDPTTSGILLLGQPIAALVFFPFGGRVVRAVGVDRTVTLGVALMLGAAVAMVGWGVSTEPAVLFVVMIVNGAGTSLALVASATDALSQFEPSEVGMGSAVFNSLRQLGAAFGVAAPAVAFELAARGSRSPDAALAGSTSAFALRVVVLLIPLALAAWQLLVARGASSRATPPVLDAG